VEAFEPLDLGSCQLGFVLLGEISQASKAMVGSRAAVKRGEASVASDTSAEQALRPSPG
jgi:hypothetical protein